jgi:hypothetical protein
LFIPSRRCGWRCGRHTGPKLHRQRRRSSRELIGPTLDLKEITGLALEFSNLGKCSQALTSIRIKKVLTEKKHVKKDPSNIKRADKQKKEEASERTSKAENTQRRKHQGKKKRERREKRTLDP